MKLDIGNIRRLCGYVSASTLAELEVRTPAGTLRLRREPGAPREPDRGIAAVHARVAGRCHLAHPTNDIALARCGEQVRAGQLLALLEAEGVLLPVRAPHAGCLQGWCVSARQPVVRGQPILYLSHERRR